MTGILWAVVQSPIALQPRYQSGKPHHITLQYGVERQSWEHLIGLPLTVGVLEECWNDRVQAISVALPTWASCSNPHPHISVSWGQDVNPVESNAMLNSEHNSAPVNFDHLICTIEFEEWGEVIKPKSWRDRPLQQCIHTWKTGERKGCRCEELTRRDPPYCTRHVPKKRKD
jgi:hypothetical protein